MTNLIRKQGVDKNGTPYTRWVRPEDANKDSARISALGVPPVETATLVDFYPVTTKRVLTQGVRSFSPDWIQGYKDDADYFKTTYSLSGGQEYINGVRDGGYVEGGAIYFPNDDGELVFTATLEGLDMAGIATAPVVESVNGRFTVSYVTNDYTRENGGLPDDYDGEDDDNTVVTFIVNADGTYRGEAIVRDFMNNLAAESYLDTLRAGGDHIPALM